MARRTAKPHDGISTNVFAVDTGSNSQLDCLASMYSTPGGVGSLEVIGHPCRIMNQGKGASTHLVR